MMFASALNVDNHEIWTGRRTISSTFIAHSFLALANAFLSAFCFNCLITFCNFKHLLLLIHFLYKTTKDIFMKLLLHFFFSVVWLLIFVFGFFCEYKQTYALLVRFGGFSPVSFALTYDAQFHLLPSQNVPQHQRAPPPTTDQQELSRTQRHVSSATEFVLPRGRLQPPSL